MMEYSYLSHLHVCHCICSLSSLCKPDIGYEGELPTPYDHVDPGFAWSPFTNVVVHVRRRVVTHLDLQRPSLGPSGCSKDSYILLSLLQDASPNNDIVKPWLMHVLLAFFLDHVFVYAWVSRYLSNVDVCMYCGIIAFAERKK